MPRFQEAILLYSSVFRQTMEMAAMVYARTVIVETRDPATTSEAEYERRQKLARIVLRLEPGDRDGALFQLAMLLATKAGMTAKVVNATGVVTPTAWTDADFDTVVSGYWTELANLLLAP